MQQSKSEHRNYDYKYSPIEDTKAERCLSLQSQKSEDSSLQLKATNSLFEFESVEVLTGSADFDSTKMSNSKYAGVVFTDIQESYPSDGEIECRYYIVNKTIEPKPNDRIGIYKVCWKNVDEAVVIKHCRDSESFAHSPNELRLRFKLNEVVEKEKEGDFYQLCYVSEEGNVFGASTPFRVFRPNLDDLVEVNDKSNEDCDEFVVIRSEQALMQERLKQLITTNGLLEYNKRCAEHKLTSKERELESLKAEKLQCDHELQKFQSELRECNERLTVLKEKEAKQAEELELTTANLVKYRSLLRQKEAENSKNLNLAETFKSESENLCTKVLEAKNECNELKIENKRLKNQLEDMKELLKTRESNASALMDEVKRLNEEKHSFELVTKSVEDVNNEWKQKEMQWTEKESELLRKIDEMTSRLSIAKTEYEEVFKLKTKFESKVNRYESKADKWKTKSKQMSEEQQAAAASSQTAVKSLSIDDSCVEEKSKDEAIVTLPCPVCKEDIVCTHSDVSPMSNHLEEVHSQIACPICSWVFDKNMENIERILQGHVERHFDDQESVIGTDGEPLVILS